MIPDPWVALVLGLAAFRLTRLAGWDEFPLALKIRAWVIGEEWVLVHNPDDWMADPPPGAEKAEGTGRLDAAELGLPGKQPTSEVANVRPAYRRPILAHLVHCPWCVGAYISAAVYVCWLFAPTQALYGAFPFAVSAFVGLVAKNLDP